MKLPQSILTSEWVESESPFYPFYVEDWPLRMFSGTWGDLAKSPKCYVGI